MFQYQADHNAVFDEPHWSASWRADIGKASNGGISIVGSTLYIDSFDHAVYAFDAPTGRLLWRRELTNVLMNTPIVVNGVVIVGTGMAGLLTASDTFWTSGRPEGDSIFGLDSATGRVLWRFDTVGENMPTGVALVAGNQPQFVFTNGDDHVYGLNPANGALLWKQTTLGIDGMASLNALDSQVYGVSTLSDAGFFAAQGNPSHAGDYFNWTWALDPTKPGQYTWSAPYGVADASAVIGRGKVFIQGFRLVSPTGKQAAELSRTIGWDVLANRSETRWAADLSALDIQTGKRIWHYVSGPGSNDVRGSASFTSDAVLAGDTVYEPLAFSRELAAFNADTGTMIWKIPTPSAIKTSPVIAGGKLYVGDTNGNFYVINAANGTIEHTIKFDGPPNHRGFAKSPPVIVGNTLFVSNDHYVYALRLDQLASGTASSLP